jgi:4-aminobutyrate aminotransferase-like enzyme/Ser/Thr protein kinase RdoA (MazF antagonist)
MLAPNPRMPTADVAELVRVHWGLTGVLADLGSLQDQNFRLTTADHARYVIKVARPSESRAELELQNAAMRHVAAHGASFDSPEPVPTVAGDDVVNHDGHDVRVLTWVHGRPLASRRRIRLADMVELGNLAGRTALALAGFSDPAMDREIRWDARRSREVVDELRDQLTVREHRALVTEAMGYFTEVEAIAQRLPMQVVHADVTDVNAVCLVDPAGRVSVNGVLDFGDVMRTWRVGDIAATASTIAGHPNVVDALDATMATLRGYLAACPLTGDEIDAFWPLVLARAAVNLAVCEIQYELNPTSEYTQDSAQVALRSLQRVLEIPIELARAAARATAGLDARPASHAIVEWLASVQPAPMVAGLPGGATVLDLCVDSDAFAYGEWLDESALAGIVAATELAVGRWGESRLVDARDPEFDAAPQLHLGADVFAAAGTPVAAPVAGIVARRSGDDVVLELRTGLYLRVSGIAAVPGLAVGAAVRPGEQLGTIASATAGPLPAHVHVQLQVSLDWPSVGTTRHRAAWLAVCPDPSALLGLAVAAGPPVPPEQRRAERGEHVASPQHLYYDAALEITRGWRHYLYDSDGRPYLDMINNIASVGHTHPRITAAATRQLRRLNTNSRFLYDAMTRYSQRIADLLPAGLDRVFLVNSGSEAADLALQLARVFTGRRDVVAIAGAYHGWTGAVIDVSTSPVDRPQWREELPPWVHVTEQPDAYRGRFGADAASYLESVRAACVAAEPNGGVAAFLAEPLLGNQGAVEPVPGFYPAAYDAVRAAGGLCIADEVQVGMGRTGDHFWAFEHEGVVPDIVFTAKATGNGHPLGVVVCRAEIADRFDGRTAYFSSTGGGPVSCEIGLAVLDVIRDEGLQRNAHEVGGYLKARLGALVDRHPLIGAIHGRGLYLGVDLVRDRATKEPATDEAAMVSERLRELGVIMQPTGDALNVLKVKPPLCIDRAAADYFVSALDTVLDDMSDR